MRMALCFKSTDLFAEAWAERGASQHLRGGTRTDRSKAGENFCKPKLVRCLSSAWEAPSCSSGV